MYNGIHRLPAVKRLKSITLVEVPNVTNGGCTPFFEVYRTEGLNNNKIFTYPVGETFKKKDCNEIYFDLTEEQKTACTLTGDIKIIFKQSTGKNSSKTLCRIMFNSSFIQTANYLEAGKMELSPEDIRKDKGKVLSPDFTVYLWFEDYCTNGCSRLRTLDTSKLCTVCKPLIGEDVIQQFESMRKVLDNHVK